jgi:hypothetical protein
MHEIEAKDVGIKMLRSEIHLKEQQLQNCKKICNELQSSLDLHVEKKW